MNGDDMISVGLNSVSSICIVALLYYQSRSGTIQLTKKKQLNKQIYLRIKQTINYFKYQQDQENRGSSNVLELSMAGEMMVNDLKVLNDKRKVDNYITIQEIQKCPHQSLFNRYYYFSMTYFILFISCQIYFTLFNIYYPRLENKNSYAMDNICQCHLINGSSFYLNRVFKACQYIQVIILWVHQMLFCFYFYYQFIRKEVYGGGMLQKGSYLNRSSKLESYRDPHHLVKGNEH